MAPESFPFQKTWMRMSSWQTVMTKCHYSPNLLDCTRNTACCSTSLLSFARNSHSKPHSRRSVRSSDSDISSGEQFWKTSTEETCTAIRRNCRRTGRRCRGRCCWEAWELVEGQVLWDAFRQAYYTKDWRDDSGSRYRKRMGGQRK